MSDSELIKPDFLIAVFPGCSEEILVHKHPEIGVMKTRFFNPFKFPDNLVDHVKVRVASKKLTLVNNHLTITKALTKADLPYYAVYPSLDEKDFYFEHYRKTWFPNSDVLSPSFKDNWVIRLAECRKQTGCVHIELQPGETLSDRIEVVTNTDGLQVFREK